MTEIKKPKKTQKLYYGKADIFALIAASIYVALNTAMLLFSPLVSPPSPVSGVVVSVVDAAALIFCLCLVSGIDISLEKSMT